MEHITPPAELATRLSTTRSRMSMTAHFFSAMLMQLKVVWVPASSAEIDTMATDGKHLFINPAFFSTLTDKQLLAVLIHEVLHVTDRHHLRVGNRDGQRWNVAADYAINPIVIQQCGNNLPDGALFNPHYDGLSAEQIYAKLTEQEKKQPDDGDGEPSQSAADPGACGGVIAPKNEDGSALSPAEIEQATQELTRQVAQAAQAAEKRGNLPGNVKELIKNARTSQVDWRERLHSFARRGGQSEYSWRQPNRRRLQDGIYMGRQQPHGVGEVVIGIDTSGSVSGPAFEQFAGEILAICEETRPSKVHLLYCDTQVHPESYDQDEISDILIERKGGGGTSFTPVFDWVEDRIANGEEAPQYLVYLTDGHGDAPEVEPDYPVLWVCNSTKEMQIGETIRINV